MPPDEIRNYLRAQPFVPFRIRLTDGRSYDVRYRELAMVGPRIVVIGIPVPEAEEPLPLIQSSIAVSLLHVISVEPIPSAAQQGDGQAGA